MALKLPRVTRGQAPTLLDAERANQLIDAVNALIESKGTGGIKVTVEGSGRLVIDGGADDFINVALCQNGVTVLAEVKGNILREIEDE